MRLLPAIFSLALIGMPCGSAHAQQPDATLLPGGERVIVFFAWDRPIIDGDAAAQLDVVAAAFERSPNARINLSGHADRSGPGAPNLRSGRQRADAVHAYLASRGVPGAAMSVMSYGETRPLIATADGVREPQNRRVEVVVMRAPGR